MIKLCDILVDIEIIESSGDLPEWISGIYNDSRSVETGGLYFAVPGFRVDGHDFIDVVYEAGASVCLVERFVDVPIPQIRVVNMRQAMAIVSAAYFGYPSNELCVIGVTATNGKTSTAFMIDEIVKAGHKKRGIIGTVKTEFDGFLEASILTTPESITLQHYFSTMVNKGISHVTMEVSSIGLEQHRVMGTAFDIVTLNNISREHTDQHGTYENYIAQKKKLITEAPSESYAVLNLDDTVSKSLIQETNAKVITYGYEDSSGDLYVTDLDMTTGFPTFKVHLSRAVETKSGLLKPTIFDIQLNVAGFHSVMNALVAVGVGIAAGFSKYEIESGLSNYLGVERRFQVVYQGDYVIVDDHFANAGNIDVTMKTLSMMSFNNIIFVYAIRGSRGVKTNGENAERIVHWARELGIETVYATHSEGHVTWKDEVTDEELAVFEETLTSAGQAYIVDQTLRASINRALGEACKGDIVLLAGCQGMDCGAHLALKMIAESNENECIEDLYAPIKNRVCCEMETLNE